jgi:hypothetical protein
MSKFLLILRNDPTLDTAMSPAEMQSVLTAYEAWGAKLADRIEMGRKLTDGAGRVLVPVPNGRPKLTDGPYTETKEVVGGVYLIRADDYAHAVKLCEGHPHFRFGSIEVREIDFMGGPEE